MTNMARWISSSASPGSCPIEAQLQDCRHSPHRDQPAAVIAAATRFIDRLRG